MLESLKKEFLELLDRDIEFRYAVAGYLGLSEVLKRLDALAEEQIKLREGQVKILEEIKALREETRALRGEQVRLAEEQIKIWEEVKALRGEQARLAEEQVKIWEEVKALREGQTKMWDEINRLREEQVRIWGEIKALREEQIRLAEEQIKLREDMKEGFESMRRHIDAIGARWGIISESAFREGLRGILEREFGFRIEKWVRRDEDGFVFGYPSLIDIDVAIHDGKVILVEVKSHADKRDVYELKRKSEFYRAVEGREPSRLIIITPYADEEALEEAERLGVEVYTRV